MVDSVSLTDLRNVKVAWGTLISGMMAADPTVEDGLKKLEEEIKKSKEENGSTGQGGSGDVRQVCQQQMDGYKKMNQKVRDAFPTAYSSTLSKLKQEMKSAIEKLNQ